MVGAAMLCHAPARAQAGHSVIRLEQFDGRSASDFLGISGFRQLPDGQLLIADGPAEKIVRLGAIGEDLGSIGRKGAGPNEYSSAIALFPLGADSTLFPDMANGRWHLLVGARIASTWTTEVPIVAKVRASLIGADTIGHLVVRRRLPGMYSNASGFPAESAAVIRVHRATLREDTLARLRGRPIQLPSGGGVAARNPLFSEAFGIPMLVPEQAITFLDGWVAVARLDPYRVDWYGPAGQSVRGAAIPHARVRVTAQERRAYEERLGRALSRSVRTSADHPWPTTADAFDADSHVAAPDGNVWIRLMTSATEDRTRYHVVNREGHLVAEVTLQSEATVLGFGDGRIFVRAIDSDGAHVLMWSAWPPSQR